jgi:hypothetical protein
MGELKWAGLRSIKWVVGKELFKMALKERLRQPADRNVISAFTSVQPAEFAGKVQRKTPKPWRRESENASSEAPAVESVEENGDF